MAAVLSERVAPERQPYGAYKDSAVNWIGEIPKHWGLRRVKFHGWFHYGVSLPDTQREDGTVPVYGSNGVIGTHSLANTKAPCLIIGRKGSFGKLNYSDIPCFAIDTTFFVDPSNAYADIRWLYYSLSILNLDKLSRDSAVPGLPREYAHNQPLPDPPLDEQRAIAAFLDHKTAQIDALIAEKRRLIDLLQEKRNALISHAVTKGLDPHAPMKDSGIPAVGNIPVHWKIQRNRWIFQEIQERSETGAEELLSVSHITGVTPRSEKVVNMFLAESLEGYKICRPGDLVINTMWAWMGALGVSQYEGVVSPSYHVYRLREPYISNYIDLLYRTSAYVCEITRYSKGVWSSRLRLYPDEFFAIDTITPPIDEQRQIVEYIESETAEINDLIAVLEESLITLDEYRTALISAAVTGKIDVQEWQEAREDE